jgi:hypothetical protein
MCPRGAETASDQSKGVSGPIAHFVSAAAEEPHVASVRGMKLRSVQVDRMPRELGRHGERVGSSRRAGRAEKDFAASIHPVMTSMDRTGNGASSCVGGAVVVWVTEDLHGWRVDVSAPAAKGGERLRLRSTSPNSLRSSSSAMIVGKLGGAKPSSTTPPGHSATNSASAAADAT